MSTKIDKTQTNTSNFTKLLHTSGKRLLGLLIVAIMIAVVSLYERVRDIKGEYRERLDKLEKNINDFTNVIDGKIHLIDAKTADIDVTIKELRSLENSRIVADEYSRLLIALLTIEQNVSRGDTDVKNDIIRIMLFSSVNIESAKAAEGLRGIVTLHDRQHFIKNFGTFAREVKSEYYYTQGGLKNNILGFISKYVGMIFLNDESSKVNATLANAERHLRSNDMQSFYSDVSSITSQNHAVLQYQKDLTNYILYKNVVDKIYDIISATLIHA